jgi:hypothetical protein
MCHNRYAVHDVISTTPALSCSVNHTFKCKHGQQGSHQNLNRTILKAAETKLKAVHYINVSVRRVEDGEKGVGLLRSLAPPPNPNADATR